MDRVGDLYTPALVVDGPALARNLDLMSRTLPGERLRPHLKAHKCTALAREQAARGHTHFTGATPRELVGLARAGIGEDLLLANECVIGERLRALATCGADVTVAIDSKETFHSAVDCRIPAVLIDVNVGMPRCGIPPEDAGALADDARKAALDVRGVMGYEGHAVLLEDRDARIEQTTKAMDALARAHADVGGDIVSAGGTGTYDINTVATEIQAGSYALMDTAYAQLDLPFERALAVAATVVHVAENYAVADCGLKALGMDHGNPTIDDAQVWFCSDEHITFAPVQDLEVGDVVLVWPAHVDPTVAYHDRMHIAEAAHVDAPIIDEWAVDLRGWDVSA